MSRWEMVRLGEIAPILQSKVYIDGDKIWLLNLDKVEPQTGKIIDYMYVNQSEIGNSVIQFDEENVLYSKLRPYLNKVVLPDKAGYATSEMIPLKPNKDYLIREYFAYYLRSESFVNIISEKVSGAKMPRVVINELKNVIVPIPPLEVQKKIAHTLDTVSDLIKVYKEQLEQLELLVKSQFVEMFGDPITNSKKISLIPLGEICNMKAGKGIKASDIFDTFKDGMYPCYGGNGLRGYVSEYTHEGAIPLIGRQGALCGNIQYAVGRFYATEHAVVTQPKIPLNAYWLYIMLREMNLNRLASGAAQPGLNVSTLVPLEVINPPIDLQNLFADFVTKVEEQKSEVKKSLQQAEILYHALMQQYFE